jgi:hypothetical protein
MKISFIKQPGGVMLPASDIEAEKLSKFKTGEMYEVEIKNSRNPHFHRKVFAFFNFCFQHWRGGNEYQDEAAQFDVFRKHLTCLAGYYDTLVGINGEVRIEAKSLSFGSMDQETFERCYTALINAAVKNLFKGCEKDIEDKLLSFF